MGKPLDQVVPMHAFLKHLFPALTTNSKSEEVYKIGQKRKVEK